MDSLTKILKATALLIVCLIGYLVVFFGFFILFSWIRGIILIPDDATLWAVREPYSAVTSIFELIIFIVIILFYYRIKERKNENKSLLYRKTINFFKAKNKIIAVILLGMLYLYFINIICITGETIVLHGTFSPLGKAYSLKDVAKVDTGFTSSKKLFGSSKSTFYYKITLKDGKKFDINSFSSKGKNYEGDTYSAIEDIDKIIMDSSSDVVKTASLDNYENVGLAQQDMDRFERIIENKR